MAGTTAIKFCTAAAAGTFAGSQPWKGGKLALLAIATTWTSSTAQFQMSFGDAWIDVGSSIDANAAPQIVDLPPCQLQVVGTGTDLAGLTASAIEVPTNVRH